MDELYKRLADRERVMHIHRWQFDKEVSVNGTKIHWFRCWIIGCKARMGREA